MPILYEDGGLARWVEVCTIEEAEGLLTWLREHPDGAVDLAACTHLHTALCQLLLAARPALLQPPGDPFLRQWVLPLLTNHGETHG